MRFYRYFGIAVVALAVLLVGGVYAMPSQPQQVTITNTIIQAPPTTSEDSAIKISVGAGLGSGVHIGGGDILTAAHVVGDAKTVKIKTFAGIESDADVLWVNKDFDIALIHRRQCLWLQRTRLPRATLRRAAAGDRQSAWD